MSHIINSEKDIKILSQQLEKIRSKGYTDDVFEEVINTLIPNNKFFPIDVKPGDRTAFRTKKRCITFCTEGLKKYLYKQLKVVIEEVPSNLRKELYDNCIFMALLHEIEHYYQYLIGQKYIDFPYQIVSDSYKDLFSTDFQIRDVILNPIYTTIKNAKYLYYSHQGYYLRERNANVEAYDALLKVIDYENNNELLEFFAAQILYQLSLGYDGKYNGSMEKSYMKTWNYSTYKSFDHTEEIPLEDRVRYGLPVDKDTKQKVLSYQFDILKLKDISF